MSRVLGMFCWVTHHHQHPDEMGGFKLGTRMAQCLPTAKRSRTLRFARKQLKNEKDESEVVPFVFCFFYCCTLSAKNRWWVSPYRKSSVQSQSKSVLPMDRCFVSRRYRMRKSSWHEINKVIVCYEFWMQKPPEKQNDSRWLRIEKTFVWIRNLFRRENLRFCLRISTLECSSPTVHRMIWLCFFVAWRWNAITTVERTMRIKVKLSTQRRWWISPKLGFRKSARWLRKIC